MKINEKSLSVRQPAMTPGEVYRGLGTTGNGALFLAVRDAGYSDTSHVSLVRLHDGVRFPDVYGTFQHVPNAEIVA